MYLLQRSKPQLPPKRSPKTYSYPDPLSLHWPKGAQVTTVTLLPPREVNKSLVVENCKK